MCGHVSELDLMQQRVGLVQVVADAAIEVAAVVVAAPVIEQWHQPSASVVNTGTLALTISCIRQTASRSARYGARAFAVKAGR